MLSDFIMNDLLNGLNGDLIDLSGLYNIVIRVNNSTSDRFRVFTRISSTGEIWKIHDSMESNIYYELRNSDFIRSHLGNDSTETITRYQNLLTRSYLLNISGEKEWDKTFDTSITSEELLELLYKSFESNSLSVTFNDESVVKFEARPYLQQLKRINDILHTLRSFEFEEYRPGDELDRLPTDPLYNPSVYQYWNEVLPQVVDKEYTRFQMYTIVTNLIEEFEKNQNDTMTMIYKL